MLNTRLLNNMAKPFSTAAALVLAVLLLQCCQDDKGGNAGRLTTFEPCVP